MTWLDVDGACAYLGQGQSKPVSRKTVYAMVAAGMRVAPRGDSGKRFWFCAEWIDEHLAHVAAAPSTVAPFPRERSA